MCRARRCRQQDGFTLIEILVVVAIIGCLMTLGMMFRRSMARSARIAKAESRLRQVGASLELYFRDHQHYPTADADLAAELAPYVGNPELFANPLRQEALPGRDLSELYHERSLEELDSPGTYLACFPPDGSDQPFIVLETGGRVVRKENPGLDREQLQLSTLLAVLYPQPRVHDDTPPAPDDGDDGSTGTGDPTDPPDEPFNEASPDDYARESPEGVISPTTCCDVTFRVLDARLTWGPDGPDVPMRVFASVAGRSECLPLFGGRAVAGGESHTLTVPEGTECTLACEAEYGLWAAAVASETEPHRLLTLRNGDTPVEFDPYQEVCPVGSGLQGLLDPATGTVTIADNEVLYLAELGSSSQASGEFDHQDLVILATFASPSNPAECVHPEEADDGFYVGTDGDVVTRLEGDVTITCIGSQFGYEDGTLVPVAAAAKLGSEPWLDLFGGQGVQGGESYHRDGVAPGTAVTLRGEIIGDYERWLWTEYGYPLSYDSNDGSRQVLVYQNGEAPPDFAPGFPCQTSAGDLLAPYVDPQTGVVTIAENEVIVLWDFNPRWTNEGIDYQDLILLATAQAAASDSSATTSEPTQ
jgi:prepilin-type N-terminal cleavage/methylation domain-containing protein